MGNTVNKKKQKKRKDLLIRISMIIAIFIVIVIAYNLISNLHRVKLGKNEYEFYQYLYGRKLEYSGILEMSDEDGITKFETGEETIVVDSIPVYYKNEKNTVILPKNMAVVFPLNNGKTNKVNSLSTVYTEYDEAYIKKGKLNRKLENCFLYDGNDLYFFIEETRVSIGEREFILPPLSYVNATYKGYTEIYNYRDDEYEYIDELSGEIIASTGDYTINLSNETIKYNGTEQILLKRIKNLPNLENN